MIGKSTDRREHRRYEIDQRCRVTIGQGQIKGQGDMNCVITNISLGGAAIRFALRMAKPPAMGTPINLYIGGVGDFPSRVMRRYADGFAVAFRPRKTWDALLVIKLERLLQDNGDGE